MTRTFDSCQKFSSCTCLLLTQLEAEWVRNSPTSNRKQLQGAGWCRQHLSCLLAGLVPLFLTNIEGAPAGYDFFA